MLIIIQLNIAFWLNGEMVYFWTFLSMIQILCYMPIIRVNLPPNVEIFLESMRHIAEFTLFDTHAFISGFAGIFGIPEYVPKGVAEEDYQNAGFRTFNFWSNMEYIFFVLALFLFIVLIIFITSRIKKCRYQVRAKKTMKKLGKRWFWSSTIRTVSVTFLYIMIAFAIASKVNEMAFDITLGAILALYPLWTLVFLFYYRMSLINRAWLETYWALYGNLKYK